jgi:hypothetical protein
MRIVKIAAALMTFAVAMLFLADTSAYAAQAHTVSVGSPDFLGPGGDGNFSLTARIDAAGNVSGQWQDAFTQNQGFHINVTCLTVVGNQAWVGGVITQAANPAFIGVQARTLVVDNGQSSDTIGFTVIFPNGNAPDCSAQPAFQQFPLNQGQVKVN